MKLLLSEWINTVTELILIDRNGRSVFPVLVHAHVDFVTVYVTPRPSEQFTRFIVRWNNGYWNVRVVERIGKYRAWYVFVMWNVSRRRRGTFSAAFIIVLFLSLFDKVCIDDPFVYSIFVQEN